MIAIERRVSWLSTRATFVAGPGNAIGHEVVDSSAFLQELGIRHDVVIVRTRVPLTSSIWCDRHLPFPPAPSLSTTIFVSSWRAIVRATEYVAQIR